MDEVTPPRKRLPARSSGKGAELAVKNELETAAEKIKVEGDQGCKECVLCAGRTDDTFDIFCESTCCGQVLLSSYICKVANLTLTHDECSLYTCYSCFELINFIERAELEYLKQRDILLDIISRNPALSNSGTYETLDADTTNEVKVEFLKSENIDYSDDDTPLKLLPSLRAKPTADCKIEQRENSSDEDFYWKEDANDEVEECNRSSKKHKKGQNKVKKSKNKNGSKISAKVRKSELSDSPAGKKFTGPPLSSEKVISSVNRNWPYICEVCGKGFRIRRWCNAHVLLHQGIADYKCIPCDRLFATKFTFLRHDKIHNGIPSHQCDLCGKSFIHKSSLRKHKMAHMGVRDYACDLCGLAFMTNTKLTLHKMVHTGEKNFECDGCGRKFARKSNMQAHYERRHAKEHPPPKPDPPEPPLPGQRRKIFRCELCPEKFDRLFKKECHLIDAHGVHLKKGRPKPRNTMKKMQRARALVVRLGAAAAAQPDNLSSNGADVKPSVSALNALMQVAAASVPAARTGPSNDDSAAYIAQQSVAAAAEVVGGLSAAAFQQAARSALHCAVEYLSRAPDYAQQ